MEPKQEEVTPDRRGSPRDCIRAQQEAIGVLVEKRQADDSKSEEERQRQEAIAQTGDSGGDWTGDTGMVMENKTGPGLV